MNKAHETKLTSTIAKIAVKDFTENNKVKKSILFYMHNDNKKLSIETYKIYPGETDKAFCQSDKLCETLKTNLKYTEFLKISKDDYSTTINWPLSIAFNKDMQAYMGVKFKDFENVIAFNADSYHVAFNNNLISYEANNINCEIKNLRANATI